MGVVKERDVAKAYIPAVMLLLAGTAAQIAPASAQPAAPRPSFACAGGRSTVERLICGNVELARLDRILADLFGEIRSLSLNGEQAAQTDVGQRAWLAERNRCTAVECLRQAYFKRITELAQALPADS